ncbi:MAG: hypothetical protein IKZ87_09185 [Actinomycetaceae bacterium]|nr:hypothetical protein [Actinomycetaceae bacterium]
MVSTSTIESIAAQWRTLVDPFAGDAALAQNASSARFVNPAAYHVNNAANAVVSFVVTGEGEALASQEMDDLARLFALRTTAPSISLDCFLQLRDLVAQRSDELFSDAESQDAALKRADQCLLYSFDALMQSREKLSALALEELKKRNDMLEKLNGGSYTEERGA